MKEIDICYGEYASKWGIADFYEESEAKLRDALSSGEDFDTGWFGCKKEIRYARICRDGDFITVEVSCHMDDLWESDDLIYDALWKSRSVVTELSDEIIDSIRTIAIEDGIDDYTQLDDTLPANADFESVCEMLEKLESYAEIDNREMFSRLCDMVGGYWDYYVKCKEENEE